MGWVNLAIDQDSYPYPLEIDQTAPRGVLIGIMILTASISTLSGLWVSLRDGFVQFVLKMGMEIALAVLCGRGMSEG